MIFRIVLWAIGLLLAIASRTSKRVQGQLARDFTFVAESKDGVARSYVMNNRRISSHSGADADARCTVRFRTGMIGTSILLGSYTVGRIVEGLGTGDVEIDGEAAYVLWFYELVMGLAPVRRNPPENWPGRYAKPDPSLKASNRITREPALPELDPAATAAREQRANTILWAVGAGADPWGKVKTHKIVIDMADDIEGKPS